MPDTLGKPKMHASPAGLIHRGTIDQMTLEEKASLTSGASFWETQSIDRLGVPSIFVADGPHGLRKQTASADHLGINASVPATSFPTAATLANSWDQDLLYEVGRCVALEARAEGVAGLLGPGLNIKRNPRGGRNFEYFSEDPYLAGKLAAAFIRGVQSEGVAACPKHFAVNSQETYRMSVDEVVDERALREIYLEGFRIALAEGDPWMLMTAYNQVNGTYAHENPHLVGEVLRGEWGFDGLVVSDWGGNNDAPLALTAGSNLEMPSSNGITADRVLEAVRAGELDESVLDQRVDEFLTLLDRVHGPLDIYGSGSAEGASRDEEVDFAGHHRVAQRAAAESLVLLKNGGEINDACSRAGGSRSTDKGGRVRAQILPLCPESRVAVIGAFADVPRFQGAGSSLVNPTQVVSPLQALNAGSLNIVGYEPGFKRKDVPSPRLARRAVTLAKDADVVVLFLGLDEGAECEGVDRAHLRLARNQLALTRDLVRLRVPLVVVLAGGAPVELPFVDHIDALLHSYLPGQAGGGAIADVLEGKVNPSGKLAETYPLNYGDLPGAADFTVNQASAEHRESIYLGYRYYDKVGMPVRFPFGFGLSYTNFEYVDAALDWEDGSDVPHAVSVTVKNVGPRLGAETVQVYVQAAEAANQVRALRELRGFAKVTLEAGQSHCLSIPLSENAFSVFDVEVDGWVRVPGKYQVLVASSSRDVRLRVPVTVDEPEPGVNLQGRHHPSALAGVGLPSYRTGRVGHVNEAEFSELLGRTPPPKNWDPREPLTENSVVAQLPGHSTLANLVHGSITGSAKLMDWIGQPTLANYARFLLALPLRSLSRMSSGVVSVSNQNKIITWLNGEASPWRRAKR